MRYQFTLERATNNFRFTLGGLTGVANVRSLNSNGNEVVAVSQPGNRARVLNRQSLAAGTYFIENAGDVNFDLNFRA